VSGKKFSVYPDQPENTNNPTLSLTVRRIPVATDTLRGCTSLPPKKLRIINSPFFLFSILQAIKVEICHLKGSIGTFFRPSIKPISLKTPKIQDYK
jgi:hypothetical protein